MTPAESRRLLERCLAAAIRAADPYLALQQALAGRHPTGRPVHLIAAGKAAEPMMGALVEWLGAHGVDPADGVAVGTRVGPAAHPRVRSMAGEHPMPGAGSQGAAEAIHHLIAAIPAEAEVHVALSGGASALIAGPLPGHAMADVTATFDLLHRSGLDIAAMNTVRKRITRWSAGRMAIACAPAVMTVWLMSDVADDDPSTIGSGPCHADRSTPDQVVAMLGRHGLLPSIPDGLLTLMSRPTPPASLVPDVETVVIGSNAVARAGAAEAAAREGWVQRVESAILTGEAADAGRELAIQAMRMARDWRLQNSALTEEGHGAQIRSLLLVFGSETTVTLDRASGTGGRCQELALAAAAMLDVSPDPITLLACGTDGRDGPTDAAGAVVDQSTWSAIDAAGIDAGDALARHDSHPALDAVGALIRTGPTGTNVMDLVLVLIPASAEEVDGG